jgi:hypothetical protein
VKYLTLIYADEAAWEAMPDEARETARDRYQALTEEMRAAGVLLGGDQLAPTGDATTIRVRGGETLVMDGPYAEVKEALGGYYLLDCGSLDEALDWAARIPAAERSGVEVRPLVEHGEEGR